MDQQLITHEPKEQYWHITKTGLLSADNEKIIVKSYRELRDYVHNALDWIRSDAFNEIQYDENTNIKHLYKHVTRTRMYREANSDNTQAGIPVGHVFEINASMKNGEIEPLITYWCERVSKRNVGNVKYSGFKEIEY